jgi:hypothetical protein
MSKQLLNEAEGFLLDHWDRACRLEESMESIRKKYKSTFDRVIDAVTKSHPELNASELHLNQRRNEGEIGFGRESWPRDEYGPSGLWVVNLKLERLANHDLEAPYACIWVRGKSELDLEAAGVVLKEEAKKILTSEEVNRMGSEWTNVWKLPAPSRRELLTAFTGGDGEEFVKLFVDQFDQMARFVPVLDKVFSDYYSKEFMRLAADWHKDTDYLSSMEMANRHPAYQEIIRLGLGAVPFMLRDLEDNHTHWFTALETITGAKPTTSAIAGNIPKMAESWLFWAGAKGYQW